MKCDNCGGRMVETAKKGERKCARCGWTQYEGLLNSEEDDE